MKKLLTKLTQTGGIIALALILGIGVTAIAANYTGPTAPPPGENAPVPINITSTSQEKGSQGSIVNSDLLKVWGNFLGGNNANILQKTSAVGGLRVGLPAAGGQAAAPNVANIIGKLFLPNTDTEKSGIKIGGTTNEGTLADTLRAALDIDLTGRTGAGGVDGVSIKSAVGSMVSAFITNSEVFHFWSDKRGADARLYAGSVKLSEYNPAAGKILVSGDANGNGVWGSLSTGNIVDIKYVGTVDNDGGSPRLNKAYCPTGYIAIGGGGDCQKGATSISRPISGSPNGGDWTWANVPANDTNTDTGAGSAVSGPANGWMVECSDGGNDNYDIHVSVVCMKVTPPTITYPAVTAVTAVTGAIAPPGSGTGSTTTPSGLPLSCGTNSRNGDVAAPFPSKAAYDARNVANDCAIGPRSSYTATTTSPASPPYLQALTWKTWQCGPAQDVCMTTYPTP